MQRGLLLLLLIIATAAAPAARAARPRPLKQACGKFTPTAGMRPLWLRTSDGIRLYAAETGSGKTAVVLAHESPADLCGWLEYVPSLTRAGLGVLAFDFRGFGDSGSASGKAAIAYDRDLRAAIAHVRAQGARRVILMGASFGGAAALADAYRLDVDGVVSLSGEPRLGPPAFDGLAGVRRLHVPLLLVGSRLDRYCDAAATRRLLRRAGSKDKHAQVYPGAFHGWDIVEDAPYAARARAAIGRWLVRIAGS